VALQKDFIWLLQDLKKEVVGIVILSICFRCFDLELVLSCLESKPLFTSVCLSVLVEMLFKPMLLVKFASIKLFSVLCDMPNIF